MIRTRDMTHFELLTARRDSHALSARHCKPLAAIVELLAHFNHHPIYLDFFRTTTPVNDATYHQFHLKQLIFESTTFFFYNFTFFFFTQTSLAFIGTATRRNVVFYLFFYRRGFSFLPHGTWWLPGSSDPSRSVY